MSPEVRSTNKTFKGQWLAETERQKREIERAEGKGNWPPKSTALAMSAPILLKSLLPSGQPRGSHLLLPGLLPRRLDSIPGEPSPNVQG